MKPAGVLTILIACGAACAAAAQAAAPAYAVKPSEVSVPAGEALGQYRRVIQPFKNWTLICDESLKSGSRVCNITQTIVDRNGAAAFNWSLVATADGRPLMVMRIPAAGGPGRRIELAMGPAPDRIVAAADQCDRIYCTATIAIGEVLKKHIHAGTPCAVTYGLAAGQTRTLQAPLEGLSAALAGVS